MFACLISIIFSRNEKSDKIWCWNRKNKSGTSSRMCRERNWPRKKPCLNRKNDRKWLLHCSDEVHTAHHCRLQTVLRFYFTVRSIWSSHLSFTGWSCQPDDSRTHKTSTNQHAWTWTLHSHLASTQRTATGNGTVRANEEYVRQIILAKTKYPLFETLLQHITASDL